MAASLHTAGPGQLAYWRHLQPVAWIRLEWGENMYVWCDIAWIEYKTSRFPQPIDEFKLKMGRIHNLV
jgi:hypothetical protein